MFIWRWRTTLVIIPAINKIDMPAADPERVAAEMADTFGFSEDEMLSVSGKTGEGVEDLLERIVELTPAPMGERDEPLQALVFDSKYDSFKGVVAYVRVLDGAIKARVIGRSSWIRVRSRRGIGGRVFLSDGDACT